MRACPLHYLSAGLVGVGLGAGMGLGAARADVRTVQGFSLQLTLATDSDVTIETDPSLTGAARVVGDALDCLTTQSGPDAQISTSACDSDMGDLAIMVPAGMPVSLEVAGSGNVSVGALSAPLKAIVSADGDLRIRRANFLQLEVRGSGDVVVQAVDGAADIAINASGDVRLMRLAGPLKFRQNASGDLAIVQIDAPVADIETRGSGDTLILGRRVGALRASTHGSGDVVMNGTVGTATLEANSGGDISLRHAEGAVSRHASGGSTINVGDGSDIAASALRKLRASLSGDDEEDTHDVPARHHGSGFHSFLAGLVVLGLIVWGWRIIGRKGGFGRIGRAFGGSAAAGSAAGAPRDPGVLALCDLLAGLERRLARVEMHVTSREFELNRKFREIDAG